MHRKDWEIDSSLSFSFSSLSSTIDEDESRWVRFRKFIWNREKRSIFNRHIMDWGQLFIIYTIFTSCVAASFFLAMFCISSLSTNELTI